MCCFRCPDSQFLCCAYVCTLCVTVVWNCSVVGQWESHGNPNLVPVFRVFVLQNHKYVTCLHGCYLYALALAHIAISFCPLTVYSSSGWQCVSSGPVRWTWHSHMLCWFSEEICTPGTTEPNHWGKRFRSNSSLEIKGIIENKPQNLTVKFGCNIFSGSVRLLLQNIFYNYYCSFNWQEQCFYHLRTIQQLGYIVFCQNRVNEGVGSFEVRTGS